MTMKRLIPLLAGGLIAGCTTLPHSASSSAVPLPRDEFASTDTYSRPFPGNPALACEAARRALLSQGYVIAERSTAEVIGRKKFQPQSDVHMQLEFHVVCAADSRGSNSSTVFANAVRDRYTLKRANTSASLGVGGIGSVSLPFGGSDDSLVKVASETIPAKSFYEGFFAILERYLDLPEGVLDIDPDTGRPVQAAPAIIPAPASFSAPVLAQPVAPATAPVTAPAAVPVKAPAAVPAAATAAMPVAAPVAAPATLPAAAPAVAPTPVPAPATAPVTTTPAAFTAAPSTTAVQATVPASLPIPAAAAPVPAADPAAKP